MPWLASSYAFPNVSYHLLSILTDLFSWTFLSDDEFDEKSLGKDPVQTSIVLNEYTNVLYFKPTSLQNKLISPLKNIMERLIETANIKWLNQFRSNMENYFEGCLRESFYRASLEVPSFYEYCKLRLLSSGMSPVLDMIELGLEDKLSENFKSSKAFSDARNIATYVCAWANDIYSFPKEFKNSEPCNLITSIMTHENVAFDTAFEKSVNLHNKEIENFITLEKETLLNNRDENKIVKAWFDALKSCMTGFWFWTLETERYQVDLNDATNRVFFEVSSNSRVPS